MTTRRIMTTGLAAGAASLLSSCGTIIYPDRVNQEERGNLDPAVIILDGIGLFFFIMIYAAFNNLLEITVFSTILSSVFKLWYLDRMVLYYENNK